MKERKRKWQPSDDLLLSDKKRASKSLNKRTDDSKWVACLSDQKSLRTLLSDNIKALNNGHWGKNEIAKIVDSLEIILRILELDAR